MWGNARVAICTEIAHARHAQVHTEILKASEVVRAGPRALQLQIEGFKFGAVRVWVAWGGVGKAGAGWVGRMEWRWGGGERGDGRQT